MVENDDNADRCVAAADYTVVRGQFVGLARRRPFPPRLVADDVTPE